MRGYIVTGQLSMTDILLAEAPAKEPAKEPAEQALKQVLKPLTLEQVNGLDMCRSRVWIETRPYPTKSPDELYHFYLLFPALFTSIGIPIGSERKHYHFRYTYLDGRNHTYYRVDEFYGKEWRVWPDRPSDTDREATPWK